MKKLIYFIVLVIFVALMSSCDNKTATSDNKLAVLECSFKGPADFTTAIYVCYGLGYAPANLKELSIWAKNKKGFPDRIYLLGMKNGGLIFIDKAGVIQAETILEANEWLINERKILFLARKDSAIIKEFYGGKDPNPVTN